MTPQPASAPHQAPQRHRERQFDWAVTILASVLLFGLHLDAWAHHRFTLETFFTPWHGLLYGGYALLALLLATAAVRGGGMRPGAMPAGYGWSLIGATMFGLGGLSDLLWHTVFGIEVNVEALLSPPHLLLALGGGLMITGPVRAALTRRETQAPWPALVSLALLLSLLTFFTAYVNPLAETAEVFASGADAALGVAGVLVQSALLMGVVLFAIRHFTLPPLAITMIVTLSSALMLLVHGNVALLPVLFAAGLAADGLYARLQPGPDRPGRFRTFAALISGVFFLLILTSLHVTGELTWSVSLTSGAVALAALVGWLVSYSISTDARNRP